MQIRSLQHVVVALVLCTVFTFIVGSGELAAMTGSVDYENLEKKVALLGLGFGEYHIANKLSGEQKKRAQKTLQEKSYPGTYTFSDGEIFILVIEETDTILAVYRKNEDSGKEGMKQMVADLMAQFGNPTSEAHDQIIYWAYSEKGKISDEEYDSLKQADEQHIIATVKFKSKLTFTENDLAVDQENSIHCIVSSPRILEKFYQQ